MFTPNQELKKKILDLHMVDKVKYCYQCNRCTTVCPVADLEPERYDPRGIIMQALLGLTDGFLTLEKQFSLWGCQTCDLCDEICPNSIVLTDIFNILKNAAITMGIAPEAYHAQAKAVMETGYSVPLQDAIKRRRNKMELPELPKADYEEVKKILKATKFDKKIGYVEPMEEK